jgi:hypothetical protein
MSLNVLPRFPQLSAIGSLGAKDPIAEEWKMEEQVLLKLYNWWQLVATSGSKWWPEHINLVPLQIFH